MENTLKDRLDQIDALIDKGNRMIDTGNKGSELVSRVADLLEKLAENRKEIVSSLHKWKESSNRAKSSENLQDQRSLLKQTLIEADTLTQRTKGLSLNSLAEGFLETHTAMLSMMTANIAFSLLDGYLTRKTIKKGFNQVNVTLEQGFVNIASTLTKGFERLDATFNWGISELIWRLDQQSTTAAQIRDILISPLDTQARELRQRGIESYNYGWFDVALLDLQEAMEKARVDFVAAHYIGNIYLFYEVDYEKAIYYFGQAARFSEPKSKRYHLTALMHQGFAYYLAEHENKTDDWLNAAKCLRKAVKIAPDSLELRFQLAQYSCLCGDEQTALDNLDYIIRSDVRYVVRVLLESDFFDLRSQIESIIFIYQKELEIMVRDRIKIHEYYVNVIRNPPKVLLGSISGQTIREWDAYSSDYPSHISADENENIYVCYGYDGDDDILRYLGRLSDIVELFGNGDVISLRTALDAINRLPVPEEKKGHIIVTFWAPQEQRSYGEWFIDRGYDFPYYGIGGDLL